MKRSSRHGHHGSHTVRGGRRQHAEKFNTFSIRSFGDDDDLQELEPTYYTDTLYDSPWGAILSVANEAVTIVESRFSFLRCAPVTSVAEPISCDQDSSDDSVGLAGALLVLTVCVMCLYMRRTEIILQGCSPILLETVFSVGRVILMDSDLMGWGATPHCIAQEGGSNGGGRVCGDVGDNARRRTDPALQLHSGAAGGESHTYNRKAVPSINTNAYYSRSAFAMEQLGWFLFSFFWLEMAFVQRVVVLLFFRSCLQWGGFGAVEVLGLSILYLMVQMVWMPTYGINDALLDFSGQKSLLYRLYASYSFSLGVMMYLTEGDFLTAYRSALVEHVYQIPQRLHALSRQYVVADFFCSIAFSFRKLCFFVDFYFFVGVAAWVTLMMLERCFNVSCVGLFTAIFLFPHLIGEGWCDNRARALKETVVCLALYGVLVLMFSCVSSASDLSILAMAVKGAGCVLYIGYHCQQRIPSVAVYVLLWVGMLCTDIIFRKGRYLDSHAPLLGQHIVINNLSRWPSSMEYLVHTMQSEQLWYNRVLNLNTIVTGSIVMLAMGGRTLMDDIERWSRRGSILTYLRTALTTRTGIGLKSEKGEKNCPPVAKDSRKNPGLPTKSDRPSLNSNTLKTLRSHTEGVGTDPKSSAARMPKVAGLENSGGLHSLSLSTSDEGDGAVGSVTTQPCGSSTDSRHKPKKEDRFTESAGSMDEASRLVVQSSESFDTQRRESEEILKTSGCTTEDVIGGAKGMLPHELQVTTSETPHLTSVPAKHTTANCHGIETSMERTPASSLKQQHSVPDTSRHSGSKPHEAQRMPPTQTIDINKSSEREGKSQVNVPCRRVQLPEVTSRDTEVRNGGGTLTSTQSVRRPLSNCSQASTAPQDKAKQGGRLKENTASQFMHKPDISKPKTISSEIRTDVSVRREPLGSATRGKDADAKKRKPQFLPSTVVAKPSAAAPSGGTARHSPFKTSASAGSYDAVDAAGSCLTASAPPGSSFGGREARRMVEESMSKSVDDQRLLLPATSRGGTASQSLLPGGQASGDCTVQSRGNGSAPWKDALQNKSPLGRLREDLLRSASRKLPLEVPQRDPEYQETLSAQSTLERDDVVSVIETVGDLPLSSAIPGAQSSPTSAQVLSPHESYASSWNCFPDESGLTIHLKRLLNSDSDEFFNGSVNACMCDAASCIGPLLDSPDHDSLFATEQSAMPSVLTSAFSTNVDDLQASRRRSVPQLPHAFSTYQKQSTYVSLLQRPLATQETHQECTPRTYALHQHGPVQSTVPPDQVPTSHALSAGLVAHTSALERSFSGSSHSSAALSANMHHAGALPSQQADAFAATSTWHVQGTDDFVQPPRSASPGAVASNSAIAKDKGADFHLNDSPFPYQPVHDMPLHGPYGAAWMAAPPMQAHPPFVPSMGTIPMPHVFTSAPSQVFVPPSVPLVDQRHAQPAVLPPQMVLVTMPDGTQAVYPIMYYTSS